MPDVSRPSVSKPKSSRWLKLVKLASVGAMLLLLPRRSSREPMPPSPPNSQNLHPPDSQPTNLHSSPPQSSNLETSMDRQDGRIDVDDHKDVEGA